jgi:hypothetical protein
MHTPIENALQELQFARAHLLGFSRNIPHRSLLISGLTAAKVYHNNSGLAVLPKPVPVLRPVLILLDLDTEYRQGAPLDVYYRLGYSRPLTP